VAIELWEGQSGPSLQTLEPTLGDGSKCSAQSAVIALWMSRVKCVETRSYARKSQAILGKKQVKPARTRPTIGDGSRIRVVFTKWVRFLNRRGFEGKRPNPRWLGPFGLPPVHIGRRAEPRKGLLARSLSGAWPGSGGGSGPLMVCAVWSLARRVESTPSSS